MTERKKIIALDFDDQEFPIVDWRAMQPWLLEKGFI